jgi:uncharacterized protein YbjT (DUF2867 family)
VESKVYTEVHLLVRTPLAVELPKLFQHKVNFDQLPEKAVYWQVEDVFCCMGTTIAKAGSQEAFTRIDHDIPLQVFQHCAAAGAGFAYLVSAVGSDPNASIFYSRVKGRLEEALKSMPWKGLHIFQPGVLIGNRLETRKAERISIHIVSAIQAVFPRLLGKYAGVKVSDLALAILKLSSQAIEGTHIYPSLAITAKAK